MGKRDQIGGEPIAPGSAGSRVKWRARWLRDPVFDGVAYRELIDQHRKPENNSEIQNVHTLCRRECVLEDVPLQQARLYITADDCYKLYINGEFVGLGPAPAYPRDYPYNAWDVTPFLLPGEPNCIGVHVFYQGLHSLTFPSGDNLQGLMLQLEIERDGGAEADVLISDAQWRCLRTDAYDASHVLGYQTAFAECIDLRCLPVGWTKVGFDDSDWQTPLVGDVPDSYSLSPQQTPPLIVYKHQPDRIIRKGEGHYFIDFGCELSGATVFMVSGAPGHEVEIRHGEELDGPGTVRYDMRCNCLYREVCTLSGRAEELLEFFDYKGFRYVEVLNWPEELTEDRVWAHERHYPFPEDASHFSSSDRLLEDIWTLCRNGVRVGTLDSYLDCPTREKGGFMGDGFVTGISHLILTGDARIMRKFLTDVAHTREYCPGLLSTAPNYVNGELAEYSLLWPVLLEYYYQWTADRDFVREMMPVLDGMLHYYAAYENGAGLLQDVFSTATKRYSVLVDWPMNLRDDYDDPYLMGSRTEPDDPEGVVNTMVQGFYSLALQAAGRLAAIGDAPGIREFAEARIARHRSAVLYELRNPDTGLFRDRNGSEHCALHANVTPLMSGMLAAKEQEPVLELMRERRLSCGVYFSFFVLKALYGAGESQLAFDLMTSHDEHSWHSMLEAGATTCMEAWAPELKWNTSWCHPWSSAPIHMIAHELMGLRPQVPGWKEIRFAPRPPAGLARASVQITTPRGVVAARLEQDGREVWYELVVPAGCTAQYVAAPGQVVVRVDRREGAAGAGALAAGEHRIVVG